jgi:hypothetical protein
VPWADVISEPCERTDTVHPVPDTASRHGLVAKNCLPTETVLDRSDTARIAMRPASAASTAATSTRSGRGPDLFRGARAATDTGPTRPASEARGRDVPAGFRGLCRHMRWCSAQCLRRSPDRSNGLAVSGVGVGTGAGPSPAGSGWEPGASPAGSGWNRGGGRRRPGRGRNRGPGRRSLLHGGNGLLGGRGWRHRTEGNCRRHPLEPPRRLHTITVLRGAGAMTASAMTRVMPVSAPNALTRSSTLRVDTPCR